MIIDELGRGTSTHDGVAIAYATLYHLVTVKKSTTLFVTHYPILAEIASICRAGEVINAHMGYLEVDEDNDELSESFGGKGSVEAGVARRTRSKQVVFLYKLIEGAASHSYGLNVARMAGLSPQLLDRAAEKAAEFIQKNQWRKSNSSIFAIEQDQQRSQAAS